MTLRVEVQRGISSFCLVVDPLTGLSHRNRSRWFIGTATCSFRILYRNVSRLIRLHSSRGSRWRCCNRLLTPVVRLCLFVIHRAVDSLQCITSLDEMRIPYDANIFHAWPDKYCVSQTLQLLRSAFKIPFDKSKFLVSQWGMTQTNSISYLWHRNTDCVQSCCQYQKPAAKY